ncbi:MAG TPA: ATP synthase subunit I [Pyrinomonadaceae bacterium]|nr:ATP synthase subunit I [Pyrinomonadaceae bacterium]
MKSMDVSDTGTAPAIDVRLFRSMIIAVASAAAISALFGPWRVSVGLLLGGALSVLNLHWMRSSIAAGFNQRSGVAAPQFKLARYVLRYFVIASVVFIAYKLRVASLPAAILGLCSFVVAVFVEALRELYFVIMRREEMN